MADSDYNAGPLIAIIALFLTLTSISVSLRLYVRVWITRAFEFDDWFMLAAQINFIIDCALLCIGVHYGLGRHNDALTLENQIQGLKFQALATLGYISNMMFIKFSIALFLLRIAVSKRYIWILRISMAIVAIWTTAIFIYDIFECQPVAAQWDFTIKNAKCVSGSSFTSAAYSISVMTITSDWLYAILPIPMIWNVQMTNQTKFTVIIILSLGIFASVATIIRLRYLVGLTDITDLLFTGTTAMSKMHPVLDLYFILWTIVEPGVAITAASLVTIRPLLRSLNLTGFDSTDPGYAGYAGQKRPNRRRTAFGHGIPNPRGDSNILSLRNDVIDNNWTSTVDCQMQRVRKASIKGGADVKDEEIGSPIQHHDGGSEEYILDGAFGIGVRRTVDVRVEDTSRDRRG